MTDSAWIAQLGAVDVKSGRVPAANRGSGMPGVHQGANKAGVPAGVSSGKLAKTAILVESY